MSEGIVIYTEKGIGLHERVVSVGHYIREEDGIWIGGGPNGPAYVQAIIDTYQNENGERPIQKSTFLMRLPPQKLGRLMELAETDKVVTGFKLVLFDPTLLQVDLNSEYINQAIDYMVANYPDDVTTKDKENWLR